MDNHEVEYQQNFGVDLVEIFEEAGATVLEKEYIDITINSQRIRLGGIFGYCLPEKYDLEIIPEECDFLNEFQNTELYSILMCHIPVCWIENDGIEEWNINMVLSGHAHGGQMRIPFLGGFYAPDEGWFPGVEQGCWASEDSRRYMVLSAGLGSSFHIPRFNNVPEIVVLDLLPES